MGEQNFQSDYAKFLAQTITGVSAQVAKALRRHTESTSRTVNCDIPRHSRSVSLRGYPIGSVTTIKNDTSRAFASGTEVDSDLFYIDVNAGTIDFDFELQPGPGALEVVYVGGMATGADAAALTDAFIAAFAELVYAIDQQIFYLWKRRDNPGVVNLNPSDFGGGASYLVSEDWAEKHGEFQPMLVEVIKRTANHASPTW